VRKAKGDLDGALHDYDEAIRLHPYYGYAYFYRASAHNAKGNVHWALRDYDEAIRLEPDNGVFYFNRAALWESAHRYLDAVADLQEYLDLGGDISEGDQAEVKQRIQELKNKDKALRCDRR
jgi:tetratricopeptide (TPR) repeat protein